MTAASTPTALTGLSEDEAARRLAAHGPNRLSETRVRPTWRIALDAMREPMFLLLLAAVILYLALGDLAEGGFLMAGAAATIGLAIFQEARSERALAALRVLAEPMARVIRGGQTRPIPAAELVPGDIVLVGEGGRAPADATLVAGDVLSVDESILTGESATVMRAPAADATPDSALFAGTLVVRGQGVALVLRTGRETRVGGIGASLSSLSEAPTELQKASRGVVRNLGLAALLVAAGVFLLHGLVRGDWVAGALASLTVGIALIPEEFPMVLAIFLALGGWRLAQVKVLVRRGAAIETLGAISILCVDKTGTLTLNHMVVAALWREARVWTHEDPERPTGDLARLLETAQMASAAQPLDPMDRALHEASPAGALRDRAPLRSSPLRAGRMAFLQAWPDGAGGVTVAAKGAPEAIFDLCRMPEAEHARLDAVVRDFARKGLRVLGVARAEASTDTGEEPGAESFRFEGLVAFEDPVREDVRPALAEARAAGVAVAMITGDYPETALSIAGQAGLDVSGGVLSGAQIDALDDAALRARVRTVRVFARISPEQKLRLVEAFKAGGAQVGMFGDGVNDAPALEAADVGVAMGRRGTDVAREAADLVLLDDRFASIIAGVREGRRIFVNLRMALAYLVMAHVPIAGLALLPVLFGVAPVLFPMQVVLLELVIDPVCAMVFEGRPSARGAMTRPPRPAGEPLFGVGRLVTALAQGLVLLAVVFGLYLTLLDQGVTATAARAAALIALVAANLAVAAVLSIAGGVGLRRPQPILVLIIAIAGVMLAAAVLSPWLARLFQFGRPGAGAILAAVALGAGAGLAVTLGTRLVGRVRRRAATSAPAP